MSGTEIAKTIRKQLKSQLDLNARQVSVKSPNYNRVDIQPKTEDAALKLETIKKLAKEHESVDRCPFTGETLSGGNTFIFVKRLDGCLA